MAKYITKMFDRIDRICDARYGSADNGVVEKILQLNPGLEDHGILLPAGITIDLPEIPTKSSVQVIKQIYLWD